jgi:hypothetical protein
MSLKDEDTEALIKRRTVLDSTVMNLCLAGVAVSPELEQEVIAVQDELTRRGKQAAPVNARTWTSWLGKKIGDYTIQYLIEEGLYWYLFHASGPDNTGRENTGLEHSELEHTGLENTETEAAGPAMLKVAKDATNYGTESGKLKYATRLFAIDGDIVREVQPAQNVFIEAEIRRFAAITHGAIPIVDEEAVVLDCQYYRTPYFAGDTLRELLVHSDGKEAAFLIVSLFSQIASALDELYADEAFAYHGNLKPENIVFTSSGVYFRELGGFGPLLCGDVMEAEVRTASPQYYPWLDVDDIGALGICLWEALVDYHPFDDSRAAVGECIVSNGLKALVDLELSLSNTFVLPLLSIKRPHQLGVRTSEKLEFVLFKSIKLKIGEDGQIYEDPGYDSLAQFNEDLLELLNETQMIF